MCGRYALSFRVSEVRSRLIRNYMPVDDAPEDNEVRQNYNVAPGSNELIYRADVPDWGTGERSHKRGDGGQQEVADAPEEQEIEATIATEEATRDSSKEQDESPSPKYKLQAMKWGLVPFWTKRKPDYGSMLKTINCRDDSLFEDRGMWTSMKRKKRCIVLCQGFYEWLKKNNGKDRIPHYVKRKDNELMCFAGLWDVTDYDGTFKTSMSIHSAGYANSATGTQEKMYSYTIITTSSNSQLKFLHDRMPVILDAGSEQMKTWLDPSRSTWTKDLQSLLKPYEGELEVYQVSKDVGKVGNNSPAFIVPIDSTENKNNIANFFGNSKSPSKAARQQQGEHRIALNKGAEEAASEHVPGEERATMDHSGTEDNAPLPIPSPEKDKAGLKRRRDDDDPSSESRARNQKHQKTATVLPEKAKSSPAKTTASSRKARSAVSNGTGSPSKRPRNNDKSQKITSFFSK